MNHLSDKDFQEYIEGDNSHKNFSFRAHIESCEMCRTNFQLYHFLYEGLSEDITWSLPEHFPDSVMEKLPPQRAGWYRFVLADSFLIIAGIAAAFCAALYFVDFHNLFRLFSGLFPTGIDFDKYVVIFRQLCSLLPDGGAEYAVFGGMIAAFIGLIDRIFLQHRFNKLSKIK